jgi:hypothetical protein
MTSSIKFWNYTLDNAAEHDLLKDEIKHNSTLNTSILDWNKATYTPYEKFVHDVAKFHLEKQGYDNYTQDIFVEFWCKDSFHTHTLHVDCDENKKKKGIYEYALFTCLTYFNKHSCPTIITNIDHDKYVYKEFEGEYEIMLIHPAEGKQITFDGKYYHGSNVIESIEDNRPIIAMNFWKNKPEDVEYYAEKSNSGKHIARENECMAVHITENNGVVVDEVDIEKKCDQYKLFNDILYIGNKDVWKPYAGDIKDRENVKIVMKVMSIVKKQNIDEIKKEMEKMETRTETLCRFYQRHFLSGFFTKEICDWIIIESENCATKLGGWRIDRHKKYPTTDLPVEQIPHVFNFVLSSLSSLLQKMLKSYCLDEELVKINVNELFVVKYDKNGQIGLDMHVDGSFLSFNIALSSINDYEGGGTLFEDGCVVKIDKGDAMWHCGKVNHGGVPIINGTRYILVGFLELTI